MGVIEYVDVNEEDNALIALKPEQVIIINFMIKNINIYIDKQRYNTSRN